MIDSYLLDTSAFRSLSVRLLQNPSLNGSFYTSPFCFWEIVTHIDEPEDFNYYKAQLMKFKYVKILDDPQADIESRLLVDDAKLKERVSDDNIIEGTLAALHASSSLAGFYSTYVEDSKGGVRQVADCAKRAREALDVDEQRHVKFIEEIVSVLSTSTSNYIGDEDRHRAILSLVEGWVVDLSRRGAFEEGLRQGLITDTYLYHSYVFHRALKRLQHSSINIDGNDYEDGRICLHLRLNTRYGLITADKGMRAALNETIRLLNKLGDPEYSTNLQVMGIEAVQLLAT